MIVAPKPWIAANFEANLTTGTAPLAVAFTDTSTGGVNYWAWEFGDGATSSERNPVHTFTTAGTYTVQLLVSDSRTTDRHWQTVTVTVTATAAPPLPVADFNWTPETVTAGEPVTFKDLSSNSPTTWYWMINGEVKDTQDVTHTFAAAGDYAVALLVSNSAGFDTETKIITVEAAPTTVTTTTTTTTEPAVPIVAAFTMDKTTGEAPLAVAFTSTSTGPFDDLVWVIYSGQTSVATLSDATPTYTFTTAGTYTVALTAKNTSTSESDTVSQQVTVTAAPIGGNQPYPSAHNVPGRVEAENYDVGGFSDTTPANEGGMYRTDAVDIEAGGSNFNVGWIRAGENLEYSVDTAAAGTFNIDFHIANPGAAKTVTVSVNGAATTLTIPATGSFGNWQLATLTGVSLNAGRNIVKVDMGTAASFNFDYMDFATQPTTIVITPGTTVVTTPPTTQTSGTATFVAVPASAKVGAAVKFTVTPTAGKTIQSVWWSFDADKHLNTWNSRTTNPTFYYPAKGTFSPLARITYTDNSVEEIKMPLYVTIT